MAANAHRLEGREYGDVRQAVYATLKEKAGPMHDVVAA